MLLIQRDSSWLLVLRRMLEWFDDVDASPDCYPDHNVDQFVRGLDGCEPEVVEQVRELLDYHRGRG